MLCLWVVACLLSSRPYSTAGAFPHSQEGSCLPSTLPSSLQAVMTEGVRNQSVDAGTLPLA